MMRFAPLALSLVLVCPVAAQRMGMANQNAPTIQQSIQFSGDESLSITYTAITWASGKTMDAIMTEGERGNGWRDRLNQTAEQSPLGSLKVSEPFMLGGKNVPAGDYKLMFTIDNDRKWHMVAAAKKGDTRVDWPLDLETSNHKSNRLAINVMAGEEDDTGKLRIAFGDMETMVDLMPGSEQNEEETGN